IYAQITVEGDEWIPTSEYIVLKRFWRRARDRAGKFAGTRLKHLASTMVSNAVSEVTDSQIQRLSFEESQLEQLVASGWLTDLSGKWRFSHDRLLTWAIAEWLAEDFSKPGKNIVEIASHIEKLQNISPENVSHLHGLGF